MASNLDYLSPNLQPLEEKLQAYLRAEKELTHATIVTTTLTHPVADTDTDESAVFEQRPPTGSYPQDAAEASNEQQNLQEELLQLRQDIMELLPVRDEWVKVNLGYGPSRVGAFKAAQSEDYELRVVI